MRAFHQQKGYAVLTYDLHNAGKLPLYEYLYRCIRRDIAHGVLAAHTRLPGKRRLAANLGVSVNTVQRALELLLAEGFIYSAERKGYFVEALDYHIKPDKRGEHNARGASDALDAQDTSNALDTRNASDAPKTREQPAPLDKRPYREEDAALRARGSSKLTPLETHAKASSQVAAATVRQVAAEKPLATPLHTPHASPLEPERAMPRTSAPEPAHAPVPHKQQQQQKTSLELFPVSVWHKCMREALMLPHNELLQALPFKGLFALREALARSLYETRALSVSPHNIIIGAGSELQFDQLLWVLGANTRLVFQKPGYTKLATIARGRGVSWQGIEARENALDIEQLERMNANAVRVTPANLFPSGAVMPIKERIKLFTWANKQPSRFIIEDDYDSELRYGSKPFAPLFAEDVRGRVVYMNTFSKTLAPSFRISYMILPDELLERYERLFAEFSSTVSSFEQYALARFIDQGFFERHVFRLRKYYRKVYEQWEYALHHSALAGVMHVEPCEAGTHLLVRIRTKQQVERAKLQARSYGVPLVFLEDYMADERAASPDAHGYCNIVINFANIPTHGIKNYISALERIFLHTT